MDQYAFIATVADEAEGDAKTYKHNISVKVDRLGKLRVDTTGTVKNRSAYLNDGSYTMIEHGHNYYGQIQNSSSTLLTCKVLLKGCWGNVFKK